MPTQNIPLTWGTYMWEGQLDFSGYGQGSPRIGKDTYYLKMYRPIFKFAPDAISGEIVSVSFNFYCDKTGGSNSDFTIHKVNRTTTTGATWYHSGSSVWSGLGCSATEEDRTAAYLAAHQFMSTGWNSIAVTNMSLFNTWFSSQRIIILINIQSPTDYASIALSPVPFLAVEYTTSLVGGAQII